MGERFETFDDNGLPAGLVPREQVHATGLWHRSAHVFLFHPDGALYIQQRSPGKDLYPGRWDFSVGEHLQPGEDYVAAAARGLREELGVTAVPLEPLGGVRRYRNDMPEFGVADHELQQAFRGTHAGAVRPDAAEVAAVRTITAAALHGWIAREPGAFTPWFLHELGTLPGLGNFALARLAHSDRHRNPTA